MSAELDRLRRIEARIRITLAAATARADSAAIARKGLQHQAWSDAFKIEQEARIIERLMVVLLGEPQTIGIGGSWLDLVSLDYEDHGDGEAG